MTKQNLEVVASEFSDCTPFLLVTLFSEFVDPRGFLVSGFHVKICVSRCFQFFLVLCLVFVISAPDHSIIRTIELVVAGHDLQ